MVNGRWITVNGNHIFVEEGQSPKEAFDNFLKANKLLGTEVKNEQKRYVPQSEYWDFDSPNPIYSYGKKKPTYVKISDLDLDNVLDNSVGTRRTNIWGDDPDKYKIKHDKFALSHLSREPIEIGRDKNGKLHILNGHHRIRALYNEGYTEFPAVVVDM